MPSRDQKSRSASRRSLAPETLLVHGGTLRSQYGETSEAVFLNSGYVYDSCEQAEARFKGQDDGFIYSRYANPTVDMFEKRMCQLEGAEDARATASGMAAVSAALLSEARAAPRGARALTPTEEAAPGARRNVLFLVLESTSATATTPYALTRPRSTRTGSSLRPR